MNKEKNFWQDFLFFALYFVGFTLLFSVLSFLFIHQIIQIMQIPVPDGARIAYLQPTREFLMQIKVSLLLGAIFAFLVLLCRYWKLVIDKNDTKLSTVAIITTIASFLAGVIFSFFILIPLASKFLLPFWNDVPLEKYLHFFLLTIIFSILIFEFPALYIFNFKINIVSKSFISKFHRFGIYLILVLSAILTPPDAYTQLLLAIPLILIYELVVWSPIIFNVKILAASQDSSKLQRGINYLTIFALSFFLFCFFILFFGSSVGTAEIIVLIIIVAFIEIIRRLFKLFIREFRKH